MTPDCPEPKRECLIDPIKLENRLTRMEGKIDQLLEDSSGGVSGKAVMGISTVIATVVLGVIEGVKAFLSK